VEEKLMGGAALISLAAVRQGRRWEEVRHKLHEELEQWVDRLEERMRKEKPPLQELTQAVWELRQEWTQAVSAAVVEKVYAQEQARRTLPCPHCGRLLKARGPHERAVETLVGEVHLRRPYFYCERCRQGSYPLDETLGVSARKKQPDVQRAVVRLTKEVPYETACELFAELTGLKLSEQTAHALTNEVGKGVGVLAVAPSREEVVARVQEVAAGKQRRPVMVLAIDGAHVPTRPEAAKGHRAGRKKQRAKRAHWQGEWREAKGFRFYLVDDDRIVHLLSWHQIQEEEELFAALEQVKAAHLIPGEQVRLCVVADGAPWIWPRVKGLFPTAREILDYYHCSEHVHAVAAAQYGEQPEKALEWVEATMARLFAGEVEGVIRGLKRMRPATVKALAEIDTLGTYLHTHRHRLHYGVQRRGGYPLSSGGIESANKFICHVRLKRSGAWWYVANGNHMLALRCAKYNGTFDRVCERYQQKTLEQASQAKRS
jgi:Uncharacterised protein family (UPF0236)